jgi:hypothetical protein
MTQSTEFEEFWDPDELARRAGEGGPATGGNGQTEWPEPEPLAVQAEMPYPIDALPAILRDAVEEYAKYGQQPIPLIATSALSAVSLAAQGLADVARDEHLCGPSSLYFLIIAISGERKTSADNWFKSPLRAWMTTRCDVMQPEVDAATAALAAWKAEHDGLLAKIKTASGKAATKDGVSIEDLRADLIALEQAKPAEVVVPRLFYEDANNPTLAADLANDWPSASLWSDEAGLIVGAHGMSADMAMGYIGLLNRLWDGNPFDRDRSTARRARMRGRRFTVSLMAQPIVIERLLTLADGVSRGMGLIARFLVTWPTSTIGTRKYRRAPQMPAIEQVRQRLTELLNMPLPLDPENPTIMALAPPMLRFTGRAQKLWESFHDDVEAELGRNGQYADVADVGAKVAENAARMAGDFHVLAHGPAGKIDSKTLFRAIKVVSYHLYEARRVLTAFDKSESITDAERFLGWLWRQPARTPPTPINLRNVLRVGPRTLRDVKRRDAAVEVLAEHHHLIPCNEAGKPRRYILNPRSVPQ